MLPIYETKIGTQTRDAQPKLGLALLMLYNTPQYNEQLFEILEETICPNGKKDKGRLSMNLWKIFVLGSFRRFAAAIRLKFVIRPAS